jgi:hypothetical protein
MKHIASILLLLIASITVGAQHFQEFIGDSFNLSITNWKITATADSGYIFNGNNNSSGTLFKSDKYGNPQWYKRYTGVYNLFDAEQTADHGYIAVGMTQSGRFVLMKADSAGEVQWTQQKVTSTMTWPGGYVHELPGGGYMIAGECQGLDTVFLCRADAQGNILWEKSYKVFVDGYNYRFAQVTPDNGFILCATLGNSGGISLLKTDSLGNIQWQRAFSPGGHGFSVTVTAGGYFISSFASNEHIAILTDSVGNPIWARQWPVNYISNVSEYPFSVVQDGDELICYGQRYVGNQTAILVFSFSSSGNLDWANYYGDATTNNISDGVSVTRSPDGGIAFIAPQNFLAKTYFVSMDSIGMTNCNSNPAPFLPTPYITSATTSAIVAYPMVNSWITIPNTAVALTPSLSIVCSPMFSPGQAVANSVFVFPNPADQSLTLKLEGSAGGGTLRLFEVMGKCVQWKNVEQGELQATLDTHTLNNGLYLWEYETGETIYSGKIIIQH